MATTQETLPAPAATTPADFMKKPWDSVFQQSEYEAIARNCMVMLERTGNTWRQLTEEEYVAARVADGARKYDAENELRYFRKVVEYTTSAGQAAKFSPTWKQILLTGPTPPPPPPVIVVNVAEARLSVNGEACGFYEAGLYDKAGSSIVYYTDEDRIAESIKSRYKRQEVAVTFTTEPVAAVEAASR